MSTILLFIFLGILGCIFLCGILLLLLLCPRVGVCVSVQDGTWHLTVFYGIWKICHQFSKKSAKKKKSSVEQEAQEEQTAPPAKNTHLPIAELIMEVLSILEEAKNQLRIDVFLVDVTLATGDAARTGVLIGYIAAIQGMIYPFLMEHFKIKQFQVVINGDFEGHHTRYQATLQASFRPIVMAWIFAKHTKALYRIWKQTKEE